jgi:hypothetical protein
MSATSEHASLDFTGSYQANMDCTWSIICGGVGEAAALRFTAFDLNRDNDDQKDTVIVYGGATADDTSQLAELSGEVIPSGAFGARGGALTVTFHSTSSSHYDGSHDGFAAEYWCVPEAELGCIHGGATNYDPAVVVDDGSCTWPCDSNSVLALVATHNPARVDFTPGYDQNSAMDCTWSIRCGGVGEAAFLRLATHGDQNLGDDTCRYANNRQCDVPRNCAIGTDASDCGDLIVSVHSGSITDDGHQESGRCVGRPTGYSDDEACTIRPTGSFALSSCPIFSTESGYDKVNIAGAEYDGTNCPSGVSVTTSSSISWRSDGSATRDGWQLCAGGAVGTGSSGSDAPRFTVISGPCTVGARSVETERTDAPPLAAMSGEVGPAVSGTRDGGLTVTSHGSHSFAAEYWCMPVADATTKYPRLACDGGPALALAATQNPTALNFTGGYQSNMDCTWSISCADMGEAVALRLTALDTEHRDDTVAIRNGATAESPLIIELSGNSVASRAFTVGNCCNTVHVSGAENVSRQMLAQIVGQLQP